MSRVNNPRVEDSIRKLMGVYNTNEGPYILLYPPCRRRHCYVRLSCLARHTIVGFVVKKRPTVDDGGRSFFI